MLDRKSFTIADVTRETGTSRTTIYEEIKAGRLQARKLGRRTLILAEDYERWLTSLPPLEKRGAR